MDARARTIEALNADPATAGLCRSLAFYYGDPAREAAMDRFHADFVGPGDLAFDLGAHVGDHVGSFRRLGARVVAVEPQPACARAIRAIYGTDENVALVEAACGAEPGRIRLYVNSDNPTVSTTSTRFLRAADGAPGWAQERWDRELDVPIVTLDGLIDAYGVPAFVKIDVEGFEDAVLAGLGRPLAALSFEFTTIERPVALRCLTRLAELGFRRFNLALGDTMALALPGWLSADELARHLLALPRDANSGDVYCRS
ncbi:FkbM family methyltransferase [Micromonospora zhanjiangensis]|uniref:FkbM family methyltransferase n=1 Tax=Micromonospora zhanjiangensis TaxID=1522057 RepID=A0ABV8KSI2_9ACTN